MMKRRLAGAAFVLAAVAATLSLGVSSALADTVLTASYPINGTTHVAKTNSDLTLGPGTLTATADLTTNQITSGTLTLPSATGTFTELGFIPVTATVAFEQVGQVTGTIDRVTGAVTATADVTLQITDLKVAGVDVGVGPACQTVQPASITVTTGPGFNILAGGPASGTYTIPQFSKCGLLGIETPVINAVIPGPGNTISLTLGAAVLN
ncbi:MAG: hypothetical protein J2P27_15895 [Actinobacteria bacterium]|nr:hypothetical protein [Actinomycetota bacterium]